jgi:hypothetical protein
MSVNTTSRNAVRPEWCVHGRGGGGVAWWGDAGVAVDREKRVCATATVGSR